MSDVSSTTVVSDNTESTNRRDDRVGKVPRRFGRWLLWGGALAIFVIASLWYGISRSGGPTVSATLSDCSQAVASSATGLPQSNIQLVLVGLGSVASVAVFQTPTGPAWCFDGVGVFGDGISETNMRAPLFAPAAVVDGSLTSDVLMLVHLGPQTKNAVVTTATSRSNVLAHGGGFEVLRVPVTWPNWHAPWPRGPVALGQILGFDREGRVTSSQPFTWCPGSVNTAPGTGC